MASELTDADGNTIWPPADMTTMAGLEAIANDQEITQELIDAIMNNPQVQQMISDAALNLGKLAYLEGESIPGITAVQNYGVMDAYKTLADALSVYAETYVFCYDWRQANFGSAADLAAFLAGFSGRDITLVGHSNGGLVISEYMIAHENNSGITNVITLGTPYLGAEQAANALGSSFGIFSGELPSEITALISPAVTALTTTIPSMLDLQPREEYAVPANAPSGGWYAIYGTGTDTSGADGDGTVNAVSATDGGAIENTIEFPGVPHNQLASDEAVLAEIIAILGSEPLPSPAPEISPTPEATETPVPASTLTPVPTVTPEEGSTKSDLNFLLIYLLSVVGIVVVIVGVFYIVFRVLRRKKDKQNANAAQDDKDSTD